MHRIIQIFLPFFILASPLHAEFLVDWEKSLEVLESIRAGESTYEGKMAKLEKALLQTRYLPMEAEYLAERMLNPNNELVGAAQIIADYETYKKNSILFKPRADDGRRADVVNDKIQAVVKSVNWATAKLEGKVASDFYGTTKPMKYVQKRPQADGTVKIEAYEIFPVVLSTHRHIFLFPKNGDLFLIIGAKVSDQMVKESKMNSAFLLDFRYREAAYQDLVSDLETSNASIKRLYKTEIVPATDPHGLEVGEMKGNIVTIAVKLNRGSDYRALTHFVLDLEARSNLRPLDHILLRQDTFRGIDGLRSPVVEEKYRKYVQKMLKELGYPSSEVKALADKLLDPKNSKISTKDVVQMHEAKKSRHEVRPFNVREHSYRRRFERTWRRAR